MLTLIKRKRKKTGKSDPDIFKPLRKQSKKEQHYLFFEGVGEREIQDLYCLATIKKLQPGETLYREGDIADSVYMLLKGQLRMVKNRDKKEKELETAVVKEGDWITEVDFMKQLIWMDSAVALTPVTIMALKKEIIHQLDDKLQLFLFKEMQRMGAERIRKLTVEKEILEKKNQELIDNIFSVRCRHNVEFGNTQLVQDLIKKIPRLPTSTLTLIHKLFDEKTSISEVAELVKNDPSLAGVVLKTINSSYYNFRQKISDMNHAIVLLGLNGVHQIIMAEKIRHSLPDTPVFQELHFHSLAISHIAFVICEASQAGRPSEMATIGLLHDIGRIVIELLKQQNPKLTLLIDSLDGAEMGAVLLRSWNLPKPVWQSIEYQFYPEFSPTSNIPDEVLENVTVLYLAHLCYHFLRKRSMEGLPTLFLDEYLSLLNRKAFSVPDIVHQFVLPALKKRINALPKFLAERVDTF